MKYSCKKTPNFYFYYLFYYSMKIRFCSGDRQRNGCFWSQDTIFWTSQGDQMSFWHISGQAGALYMLLWRVKSGCWLKFCYMLHCQDTCALIPLSPKTASDLYSRGRQEDSVHLVDVKIKQFGEIQVNPGCSQTTLPVKKTSNITFKGIYVFK